MAEEEKKKELQCDKYSIIIPKDWGDDTFEKIKGIIDDKYKTGLIDGYAWAEHEPDIGHSFHHYHIGFIFPYNSGKSSHRRIRRKLSDVIKWFEDISQLLPNSFEKMSCHENTYCSYLLHLTEGAKSDGKLPPLRYGGTLDFDNALEEYNKYVSFNLDNLCENIIRGKVKEYELYKDEDMMCAIQKANMESDINRALDKFYKHYSLGYKVKEKRMHFWLYGLAGCGKSTLACYLAQKFGYDELDVYISSAGKNCADDYMGQPIFVFDDVDSNTRSAKSFLKFLDMNIKSKTDARFHNRSLLTKIIVITSTISPSTWWTENSKKSDGNVFQFMRRFNYGVYQMDVDYHKPMIVTRYDGEGHAIDKNEIPLPLPVIDILQNKNEDVIDLSLVFQTEINDYFNKYVNPFND